MLAATRPISGRTIHSWEKVRVLTGRAGGPSVGVPESLIERSHALADLFGQLSAEHGDRVGVHPADLLAERAELLGLARQSPSSCGGGAKLMRALDGWVAISMSRADDVALMPAWLGDGDWSATNVDAKSTGQSEVVAVPWTAIEVAVGQRRAAELVPFGAELGLAVSALGEVGSGRFASRTNFSRKSRTGKRLRVVELASLWAGPLCGRLLAEAGAEVVKIESTERPDGARLTPTFFHAMHPNTSFVQLSFASQDGRAELLDLIRNADVVIEGSRPRALRQLGIDAEDILSDAASRLSVWVSITGHGRTGNEGNRVGFGDDAAIAGGLAVWDETGPMFLADACADPLTGLAAATEVLDVIGLGGSWMLDVPLSHVAAVMAN